MTGYQRVGTLPVMSIARVYLSPLECAGCCVECRDPHPTIGIQDAILAQCLVVVGVRVLPQQCARRRDAELCGQ